MDLISLADTGGNRCVVRVTGRWQPGILTGHDILRADVLVSASFVDARLDLYLLPEDLDAWQRGLTDLAPGRDAGIGGDRGLSLLFHMYEGGLLSVEVDYPDRLTAELGIRPQEEWVLEHLKRLEQVRLSWPREVIQTASGVYEWSPNRKR